MIYTVFICKTGEKHIALSEHTTLLHLIQGAMARQRGIIYKHLINGKVYWTEYMYIIIGMMWSQLSQCSQLSQSTTIVATPITIVAKNHNCRNFNHNCRNPINHNCRNCNHNSKKILYTWLKDDVSLSLSPLNLDSIFHNYCCYFALITCYKYL
mgnify:CR=1 FL=1